MVAFNIVIKLLLFLKINFKCALDDSKGNLSVKVQKMSLRN